MTKLLKRLWAWITKPSPYGIWEEAFKKLQAEKKVNGRSLEYWRIWHEEVCPAYRRLTEATPRFLKHPKTDHILKDMDKPVSQRKYY